MLIGNRRRKNTNWTAVASCSRLIATFVIVTALFQAGCSKKTRPSMISAAPVKVAMLPFNAPEDRQDLKWAAIAAPISMAKALKRSPDLQILPLWETMPVAIEQAGPSRSFNQESATNAANWLSAKWAVTGDITATKSGITMTIEFIPAKENMVPFRFTRKGKLEKQFFSLGFPLAANQFLRYLMAKPLEKDRGKVRALNYFEDVARAVDREYGWFVAADPGKAQETVNSLLSADPQLAKDLFSPSIYPALTKVK